MKASVRLHATATELKDARNMKKKRNPNIIFFSSVNGLNTVVNMLMEKLADL